MSRLCSMRNLFDVVYSMSLFKHSLRAERRIQFAPRPIDVGGEALEADCDGADAGPQRAADAIAPQLNNVAQMSSWLAALASVNLSVVVGETELVD